MNYIGPIALGALLLAVALVSSQHDATAQDCPAAQWVSRGFVVERGERQKTEVFHVENSMVRMVTRYDGKTILETTQFQGLFQIDRLDQGRRSFFRPKGDLARLFPLKTGQKIKVEFDVEGSAGQSAIVVQLLVKGKDVLYIGPCKYDVFKIERSESRGGGAPRFIDTDYYSTELKLILAREYKNTGDRSTMVKYDRIYQIKQ